jgi:hypothetical protein
MENYKVIKDFPNYAISRDGEVFSLRLNRKLKPFKCLKGYILIDLSKDNIKKRFLVHRLVANAYIDNVNNYPQVNHINGVKHDNRIENLEWCTASQNLNHAFINKLRIPASPFGEKNPKSKLKESEVLKIRDSNLSQKELSILYNVSPTTICEIIKRKYWKHI